LRHVGVAFIGDRANFLDNLKAQPFVEWEKIESREPIVALAEIFARVFAAEETAGKRSPNSETEASGAHERANFMLHVPPDQRVIHLPAGKLRPAAFFLHLQRRRGAPRRPIGITYVVAHLARSHQIVQSFQSLIERRVRIFLVQDVKIEIVRIETLMISSLFLFLPAARSQKRCAI
jgi:hypothetical protein